MGCAPPYPHNMSKRQIKLRFPKPTDPGVMQFIQDFPVHVATLERFFRTLSAGGIPQKADTEAAVVALVAFAFDEPDKDEAKQAILRDMTLIEIMGAVEGILKTSGAEIESLRAQTAMNAMQAAPLAGPLAEQA